MNDTMKDPELQFVYDTIESAFRCYDSPIEGCAMLEKAMFFAAIAQARALALIADELQKIRLNYEEQRQP